MQLRGTVPRVCPMAHVLEEFHTRWREHLFRIEGWERIIAFEIERELQPDLFPETLPSLTLDNIL